MWIDIEQNTDAWHDLRLGKVTASGAASFMANFGKAFGEPAKKYALSLALQRVTRVKPESYANEHMERGHAQEPIARMLYESETFQTVTNGGFFDYDEYGCSPDGLIKNGAIEIKSVIASTHYATLQRGNFDPSYRWQIASQLDCDGVDFVDFVSYCSEFPSSKQLLVYKVTRDDFKEELVRLRERRAEFLELVKKIEIELKD